MNTLYIIGNGFDLYHGLATSYFSFGVFLKENRIKLYEMLIKYFAFCQVENEKTSKCSGYLWATFESRLADFDYQQLIEQYSDYIAFPGESDISDYSAFQIEIAPIIFDLTLGLFDAFEEWISSIEYSELEDTKRLKLDNSAIFLNFNYTETLTKYYNIPESNILYIHGNAKNNKPLVLGHGFDPSKTMNDKLDNLSNLNIDECGRSENDYNFSFELGKEVISEYFEKTFKNTSEIIKENHTFFKSIQDIKSVIILGHSISKVDAPYFKEIVTSVSQEANWKFTYYGDSEKNEIADIIFKKSTLKELGVKNDKLISPFNIDELKSNLK